jgi:sortase A
MKNKLHLFVERPLLASGSTILVMVTAALADRFMFSNLAVADFDRSQAALVPNEPKPSVGGAGDKGVDLSLWSDNRIRLYRSNLLKKTGTPLAVLRVGRLRIRVPVFEGTGVLVLNRGAGWIPGTAKPGEVGNGNIGITGHRDGFFRGLKDVVDGDTVELSTPGVESDYTVDSAEIVDPGDVEVLQPRGWPSLTLVTCYPFYFVGSAPRRFIVHATLKRRVEVGLLQNGGSVLANDLIDIKGENR